MQEIGKFVIKEPCHEDWNQMTPQEQGRFCDVCAKCVVDLTGKSQTEIWEAYQENQGDMCGRMNLSQLNVPSVKGKEVEPAHRKWQLPAGMMKRLQIFAAAFVAVFMLVFKNDAVAQGRVMMKGKVAYTKPYGHVEGKIKYDHGAPAAGLTIRLMENGQVIAETQTGPKGEYAFHHQTTGKYTLTVSRYSWNMSEKGVTIEQNKTAVLDFIVEDEAIDGGIGIEMLPENLEPIEKEPAVPVEVVPEVEPELIMLGDVAFEPIKSCTAENKEPAENPQTTNLTLPEGTETEPGIAPNQSETAIDPRPVDSLLEEEQQLTLFPNPSSGRFEGQIQGGKPAPFELEVTDLKGNLLLSRTLGKQAKGHFEVDISAYADGIYLLRVITGDTVLKGRLLKTE